MSSPSSRISAEAPWASSTSHSAGKSAYDDDRHAVELAGDQVGRTGDLVGDGGSGHGEDIAVRVLDTLEREERRDAGGADRDVGLADTPGAANRVGDDDAEPQSGQLLETREDLPGGRRRDRAGAG